MTVRAIEHGGAAVGQVLVKAGFVPAGPADAGHLGGKPGAWFQRILAAG